MINEKLALGINASAGLQPRRTSLDVPRFEGSNYRVYLVGWDGAGFAIDRLGRRSNHDDHCGGETGGGIVVVMTEVLLLQLMPDDVSSSVIPSRILPPR